MRISKKINTVLHSLMTKRVMRAYDKKSKKVEKKHPKLFRPVDAALSRQHRDLWSRMGLKSGDRWLRLHVNMTGIQDYTFCPEDIFFSGIERVMNDCNQSGYGPEDKATLYRFVPKGCEPETVVRYERGCFYDGDLNWLSRADVAKLLKGEFVGKPIHESGGSGVELRSDFTPEFIEKCAGGGVSCAEKDCTMQLFSTV